MKKYIYVCILTSALNTNVKKLPGVNNDHLKKKKADHFESCTYCEFFINVFLNVISD